jgi:hypothetical protein
MDLKKNHTLLADIQLLKAENRSLSKDNFETEFKNALSLREGQVDGISLANAITSCNFAKYLALGKNLDEA